MKISNILLVLGIAILAFAYRLIPNVPNFSPVLAVFLFAGIALKNNWKLLLVVFSMYLASDFILNNTILSVYFPETEGVIWFSTYMIFTGISYLLIFGLGQLFGKSNSITNVIGLTLISSIVFFVLTNIGSWVFDPFNLYANNLSGALAALVAGLPFFQTSILANLCFVSIFFFIYKFSISIFTSRKGVKV
jgi:hypothetical protein